MRLYLIRHAKAERESPQGRDDLRAITGRGRKQAAWLAAELERSETAPTRILSSPAVRAVETAQIVADRLGLVVETAEGIGLGAGPSRVVELVASVPAVDALALVGHNPTLSRACELLLSGVGRSGGLDLRTGQAAVLEVGNPRSPLGAARLLEMLRIPDDQDHAE